MKKTVALVLVLVLAFSLAACGKDTASREPVAFTVTVTDLDGKETKFDYTSDKATLGEALLAEGLIAGDKGEYGLYVTTVNGISADWDKDQTYWAFYIDGEYATTGVDSTEITAGTNYSFVLTKG